MRRLISVSLVVVALASCPAVATIRNVPSEYSSIQQAIDASTDGDTVIVAPGLYFERINFNGRNIVVTSTDPNDSRIVGYTILNGDGEGSVVTFENRETNAAVLTGFTITGGTGTLIYSYDYYSSTCGAGIMCRGGASPTITRNVITNNVAPYSREQVEVQVDGGRYITYRYEWSDGGGIYCSGSAIISHNVIYNNSAESGGGVYAGGYATVTNNLIYNNTSAYGGGVYIYAGSLVNNTIVGNNADLEPESGRGGNVVASFQYDYALLTVANNLICNAKSGGGLYWIRASRDAIRFNNVWGNTPSNYVTQDPRTYEDIIGQEADWTGRHGNLSQDPVFLTSWSKRYHLDPSSPCVSAGDPNFVPRPGETDIDGEPRVYALRVDIGADEHVGYVKPLAYAGDDHHILTPEPVTLDGTGSYFSDPAGPTSFQWTQTLGAEVELDDAAAGRPVFTPPAEGWYRFDLVVADGQYTSAPDTVLVVVGNERPVADAGSNSLWEAPGGAMLDGSKSADADPPDELIYTWKQLEGPPVELLEPDSATPYFLCEQAGIYAFELTVDDGFVDSEPDVVKIEAAPFTRSAEPFAVTQDADGYFFYPAVSGTSVAYVGFEDYDPSSWQVFCADAQTGVFRTFDTGTVNTKPKIDGSLVVWASGSGSYYDPICTSVYLADMVTGESVALRRATQTESYGYPAVSGNKVVWLRHRNVDTSNETRYLESTYDICGADVTDLAHPVYFTIAEEVGQGVPYPFDNYTEAHEGFVDICGDIVVWEANGDIYGADISDLSGIRTFPICTAAERQYDPAVSGNLVVWTDERNDIGDIYGADISDPNQVREFEVAVEGGWQLQADIDGPTIVYSVGDAWSGNIRMCCVTREYGIVDFYLPDYPYGGGPEVSGSTITWVYNYQITGIRLDFGYSLMNGPIENATSGSHHDYIQHAIARAQDGDVILLQPGVYDEKIRFAGRKVTITSSDPEDPAVRAATVIAGAGPLVTFADGETAESLFTGFTVAGGTFGIVCNGSKPTISHCDVVDNCAAGIKVWGGAEPAVTGCDISANRIGMEMWADVSGRRIQRNYGTFTNCLITGNREGGVLGGYPNLVNCTIADNFGLGVSCVAPVLTNCIVYFNNDDGVNLDSRQQATVTYCDIQGGWPGEGNIDADPLFVARGQWSESSGLDAVWTPGDYHLGSEGWFWDTLQGSWTWGDQTSPCIDAGDPSTPLGQEASCEVGDPRSERAVNGRINMGAYGGTAEASLAPRNTAYGQ